MQPQLPCSSWPALISQTRVHALAEQRKHQSDDRNLKIAAALLALPAAASYYLGWLPKRQFVVQVSGGVAVLLFLSSFLCYRWAAQALAKFNLGEISKEPVNPDLYIGKKKFLIKPSQKSHERDFKLYPMPLEEIKKLPADPLVTRLRICSKDVTDPEIEHLTHSYPNLTVVDLSDCVQLTDKTLGSFVKHTPHLHSLTLANCTQITSMGLNIFSRNFPDLRRLNLTGCSGVRGFFRPHLPNLQVLQIEKCPDLNTSAFLKWAAQLPHLSVFHWDQKFQPEDLEEFYKTGPLVRKMHAGYSLKHFPELTNPHLVKLRTSADQNPLTLKGPYALKTFRDLSARVWNLKELEDFLIGTHDLTTLEVRVSSNVGEGDAAFKLVAEKGTHLAKLILHGKFSAHLPVQITEKHKQIKKLTLND